MPTFLPACFRTVLIKRSVTISIDTSCCDTNGFVAFVRWRETFCPNFFSIIPHAIVVKFIDIALRRREIPGRKTRRTRPWGKWEAEKWCLWRGGLTILPVRSETRAATISGSDRARKESRREKSQREANTMIRAILRGVRIRWGINVVALPL